MFQEFQMEAKSDKFRSHLNYDNIRYSKATGKH